MDTQVLTPTQMRELEKLGIDISNASMFWVKTPEQDTFKWKVGVLDTNIKTFFKYCVVSCSFTPAFTLQDILSHFEKYRMTRLSDGVTLEIKINDTWVHSEFGKTELVVGFNMLKWWKKNKK